MQSQKSAKTKSVRKRWFVRIVALQVLIIMIGAVSASAIYTNARILRVDGQLYRLRVADTSTERELGLGGASNMSDSKGMLFVLDQPEIACFWMKGMHFSLDMIWLDSQKQVIQTAEHVSPRTYPVAFCPPNDAKYVIELAAGQVDTAEITIGQTLKF